VTTGVQCTVSVVETSSYRWLRRIVCAASHRIASHRIASHRVAPLATVRHARALQRRSNAARRSRECGVEGTKAQQGRAAIHQQDHPCRELFTSLRRTQGPAQRNESLKRRVGMCIYVSAHAETRWGRGRGRWYATSQIKEQKWGVSFLLNRQQGKNTSASGRSLARGERSNQNVC
jgi:hypothetical protein